MTQSPRDELAEIRRGFEAEAGAFVSAGEAVARPFSATDEEGVVSVTIDKSGLLRSVRLDNGWQAVLGTDGLGPAVVSTYRQALVERAQTWAERLDPNAPAHAEPAPLADDDAADVDVSGADGGAPTPGQATPGAAADRAAQSALTMPRAVQDALAARGDEVPDAALFEGLLSYMDEAEAAFDRALQHVDAMATETVQGASSSGRVRATVTLAGELQAVDYDTGWIPQAHPFNISRETVEAFADARRRAAMRNAENTSLTEVQRLGNDPQALLEHLRLT